VPTSGSAEALSTADKLLDAAARLFAERGIENASVAEIVRAAGQRNASAVIYHFGTRDDLLYAVLARHVPVLAQRRRELLDVARASGEARAAAEAIVRPVTELAQRGWRERAYLQIGSELAGMLDRTTADIRDLLAETAGHEAWERLRSLVSGVPRDLWEERKSLCLVFVGRAAADRARELDRGATRLTLSEDRFVSNLVDMVLGAMTAPAS
jgi:AcrR family transcriptional regulator